METRKCLKCKEEYPLTKEFFYFSVRSKRNGALQIQCKFCKKKYAKRKQKYKPISGGIRNCSLCKKEYPLTSKFFHKSNRNYKGFRIQCKFCINYLKSKKPKLKHLPIRSGETKQCFKCKKELPLTTEYFHKNVGMIKGFSCYCKQCNNIDNKNRPSYKPQPGGVRICSKCKKEYLLTSEFFDLQPKDKRGFRSQCKICQHDYYIQKRTEYLPQMIGTKKCITCIKTKNITEFHNNKNNIDGKGNQCIPCHQHYQKYIKQRNDPKMTGTKKCIHCQKIKNITLFSVSKGNKDGRKGECKKCQTYLNIYRTHMHHNKNKRSSEKKITLAKQMVQKYINEQNNKCDICKIPFENDNWCVDHCHDKGHVRGLLCELCNRGIGHFKDNITKLENAIKYLKNDLSI